VDIARNLLRQADQWNALAQAALQGEQRALERERRAKAALELQMREAGRSEAAIRQVLAAIDEEPPRLNKARESEDTSGAAGP
jgi:hypothetical protein